MSSNVDFELPLLSMSIITVLKCYHVTTLCSSLRCDDDIWARS